MTETTKEKLIPTYADMSAADYAKAKAKAALERRSLAEVIGELLKAWIAKS